MSHGHGTDRAAVLAATGEWFAEVREASRFSVSIVPLEGLAQWAFDRKGNLRHASGRFFAVTGMRYRDRETGTTGLQPIIDQPEHGILGIAVQRREGVLRLLLQAKIEPGNLGQVQLSPTVQATRSNYSKVHKGAAVPFLGFFTGGQPVRLLFRQRQLEHGWKFFRKSNYNIIVELPDGLDPPLPRNFRWFTLAEIGILLREPHLVNMDTRSVLSCLPQDPDGSVATATGAAEDPERGGRTLRQLARLVRTTKRHRRFASRLVHLHRVLERDAGWSAADGRIVSPRCPDFELVGIRVVVEGREIRSWDQPIVRDNRVKANVLFVRQSAGQLFGLFRFCEEPGSARGAELGPTIHNLPDPPLPGAAPFVDRLTAPGTRILYDCLQSEEGGRFHEQQNRYVIALVEDTGEEREGFLWMPVARARELLGEACFVNIEARTLLACLPFAGI